MAKYGDPSLEIDALHLTHPKCAHTHTRSNGATHTTAPREQSGVRCLAQGHLSRSIEGERERWTWRGRRNLILICHRLWNGLNQGSPSPVLEDQCPAEFSSNPNQTHLEQLIPVLLGTLAGVLRQVGAKLCRTPALQDRV